MVQENWKRIPGRGIDGNCRAKAPEQGKGENLVTHSMQGCSQGQRSCPSALISPVLQLLLSPQLLLHLELIPV